MRADLGDEEARKQKAAQRAYDLLIDYVATATELGVQPRRVEAGSLVLTATGISLASWPKASDGSISYYPLITSSQFNHVWLAAESQGLSVTPGNQFFLRGKELPATEAAAWLASVADFDEQVILETLENALRGNLASV
ncbi:hypothetical protein [Glycomyces salinus]|uniref:hypothetical protein n=1 Tax=Glycomyces salinus TaxID=980294 RepID=UPI0018ED5FE5|nr:hypothetical protein [Glycomyces salinus]